MRNAVYVEWLSGLMKHLDDLGRRNGITDAEPGEAMDFRKRPQHNYVSTLPNKSQRVERIIEEFKIRLVENDDDAIWEIQLASPRSARA